MYMYLLYSPLSLFISPFVYSFTHSLPPSLSVSSSSTGGMMSVFLMGVYDKSCDRFRTVAKCGNGHDDATITRLQHELDMVKISKVQTEPTLHVHCTFTHIFLFSLCKWTAFSGQLSHSCLCYIHVYTSTTYYMYCTYTMSFTLLLYIHVHVYTCTMYIIQDPSKVPAWLLINKSVIPDFVVKNPKVCKPVT